MDNIWTAYLQPTGYHNKPLLQETAGSLAHQVYTIAETTARLAQLACVPELLHDVSVQYAIKETITSVHNAKGLSASDFAKAHDNALATIQAIGRYTVATYPSGISEDIKILKRQHRVDTTHGIDPVKSRDAKTAYKNNRSKNTKAIQAFHKSSAGKAFHRNLSRFNALHTPMTTETLAILAKGLSSAVTHLIIEAHSCCLQEATTGRSSYKDSLCELHQLFTIIATEAFAMWQGLAVEGFKDSLLIIEDFMIGSTNDTN